MDRRRFLQYAGAAAGIPLMARGVAGLSLFNGTMRVEVGRRRPNVIYILTDDLGYGDIGSYGQKLIQTPSLDRMAAEGMRFMQHYAGTCVCAPARCVLMTGFHTGHAYIRGNYEIDGYQLPIPAQTRTIAEVFKEHGYATGCVGKWGLGGPDTEGNPNRQGFDLFFGYLGQVQAHEYYPQYLWRNDEKVYLNGNVYSHDAMTEEALNFIQSHKDRQFFLYLPYTIPHTKFQVPQDSLDAYADRPWTADQKTQAAMISRMDRDVGRIMDMLKQLAIDEHTVVFFTSDNGPHGSSGTNALFDANGPFRGIKRDVYEGGIRVPFVARWPGTIRPGTVTDHISAFWDFFPTACDLMGAETPPGLDGLSFVPVLLGKTEEQKTHPYLYWEFHEGGGKQALRKGDWKAVRLNLKNEANPPLQLFNLKDDLGETTDVSAAHPEIVREMKDLIGEAHVPSSIAQFKFYGE